MQPFFKYKLVESLDEVNVRIDKSGNDDRMLTLCCLNVHSFVTAMDDDSFRLALEECDLLLPDGVGVCWAVKQLNGKKIEKIAGDDIHKHLLNKLNETGGRVFYMGSSEDVLEKIVNRLSIEYPKVAVETLSPPYCDELNDDVSKKFIDRINAFKPNVLFVSMTAPKQEKWVWKHAAELNHVGLAASIGAVFDFYAKTKKRAPAWMIRIKCEWLYRLLREPARIWKRIFVSTPRFVLHIWRAAKQRNN